MMRALLDEVFGSCRSLLSQRSLVSCARKAGLLLFQFPGHLELWRLGEGEGLGEQTSACVLLSQGHSRHPLTVCVCVCVCVCV